MVYYVFLDTNIYEENGFSFKNFNFIKLKELVELKKVVLLYNEVIYREVKQHIEENIKKAVEEVNIAMGNRGFAPFRNSKVWKEYAEFLDVRKLIEKQWQAWENYLKDCAVVKIPTKNVNVDVILDNYFKITSPFEKGKRNEFKDAITVESIRDYFDIIKEEKSVEELYVVTADKGLRNSFGNDDGIITFSNLNKIINYVLLNTEKLASSIKTRVKDCKEIFGFYIKQNLMNQINRTNCTVEDCPDDFKIVDVKYLKHDVGYTDIINKDIAEVTLIITARIDVNYMKRNEENSYYDREMETYILEKFIEYFASHKVSFEVTLLLDIEKLNVKEIKDKVNTCNDILEKYDESILSFIVSPKTIYISPKNTILLNNRTLIEKKIVKTFLDGEEIGIEYIGSPCPYCGEVISSENNGRNGFCMRCTTEYNIF